MKGRPYFLTNMFFRKRRFVFFWIGMIFLFILINHRRENSFHQFNLEERNDHRWTELEKKFHSINLSLLINSPLNHSKTIEFQCAHVCGGLGDRLRGLMMSYFLALLSNRQLIVNMNWPCRFENYFQPNKYQWISSSNYQFKGSRFDIVAIDHNQDLEKELKETLFIEKWSNYDHIRISTNMDFLTFIFSNIHFKSHPIISMFIETMSPEEANIQTLFSLFFQILLKPTKPIENLVNQMMTNRSPNELICTHLRIGRNPSNPLDHDFQFKSNITEEFIRFLSPNQFLQKNSLFVSSDSIQSIEQIKQAFPHQTFAIPGPILQIDLPADGVDCHQGFTKVVADFYLLSECQTMILMNSGFSAFANRRRIYPYRNLFKYHLQTNTIQRCLDLTSIKGWEPSQSATHKLYCPIRTNNFTIEYI